MIRNKRLLSEKTNKLKPSTKLKFPGSHLLVQGSLLLIAGFFLFHSLNYAEHHHQQHQSSSSFQGLRPPSSQNKFNGPIVSTTVHGFPSMQPQTLSKGISIREQQSSRTTTSSQAFDRQQVSSSSFDSSIGDSRSTQSSPIVALTNKSYIEPSDQDTTKREEATESDKIIKGEQGAMKPSILTPPSISSHLSVMRNQTNMTEKLLRMRTSPLTSTLSETVTLSEANIPWGLRVEKKSRCLESRRSNFKHKDKSGKGIKDSSEVTLPQASFFLYHMRKAAGTTIRAFLEKQCKLPYFQSYSFKEIDVGVANHHQEHNDHGRLLLAQRRKRPSNTPNSQCLYESEGLSMDLSFMNSLYSDMEDEKLTSTSSSSPLVFSSIKHDQVITITTLRNPVNRIISLYWYEHVGWWDGIQHDLTKLKPLDVWLNQWGLDQQNFKKEFMKSNPKSTYVETSNYFTKSFSGWRGNQLLNRDDLEMAKKVLLKFDIVLITEKLNEERHLSVMKYLLNEDLLSQVNKGSSVSSSLSSKSSLTGHEVTHTNKVQHELKADDEPKKRLSSRLIRPNLDHIINHIILKMNEYDMELWKFMNDMIEERTQFAIQKLKLKEGETKSKDDSINTHDLMCSGYGIEGDAPLFPWPKFNSFYGIHRPPGHKK